MKKKGFTLIEILVVVTVIGIVMTAITVIFINSFRAKSRITVADILEQSGSQVLAELKDKIIAAPADGIPVCGGSGFPSSTITLTSGEDGGETILTCVEGSKIASSSANGAFDLTPGNVVVSGCSSFVTCVEGDRTKTVSFQFSLTSKDPDAFGESLVTRVFNSNVVTRE